MGMWEASLMKRRDDEIKGKGKKENVLYRILLSTNVLCHPIVIQVLVPRMIFANANPYLEETVDI